jgi:hypothetical protein
VDWSRVVPPPAVSKTAANDLIGGEFGIYQRVILVFVEYQG